MNTTPNASRLHIAIYGRQNSGKSSLINAITGEDTSVVSPMGGTTTDSVARAMELHGVGAVLWIDTPGFDDGGCEVGDKRVERTRRTIERTDIALLLCDDVDDLSAEQEWFDELQRLKIPVVTVVSKMDLRGDVSQLVERIEQRFAQTPLLLSPMQGVDIEAIREIILRNISPDYQPRLITAGLAERGDVVVMVMPQDPQAPKGRLILPQVQTLRELLDLGATAICTTTEGLAGALTTLAAAPKLVITDSQHFHRVADLTPPEALLTSFSILMAGYKGDIAAFVEGAKVIDTLTPTSRVLIAEACAHAPIGEDIGRVQLPRMLRSRFGEELVIDVVSGRNFPADLTPYSLIIHCGACMFNRKYMLHRVSQAAAAGVPITNYGVAIAHLQGLDLAQIALPLGED